MPGDGGFGEAGDDLGVLFGDVGGFDVVSGEIVEFWFGAVVIAEEFPIAFADGEVGEGLRIGGADGFAIGRATPVDGGGS